MKPYLKWAGGKARLADTIRGHLESPCAGTYAEPFAGGAAVFFARKAAGEIGHAILSDVNIRLMQTHAAVKEAIDDLLEELQRLPWGEGWEESYYEKRDHFNAIRPRLLDVRGAALFIWLNRACYNGMYRENAKGEFNIPKGSYRAIRPPEEAHLRECSRLLQGTDLLILGFEEVVRYLRERSPMRGAAHQIYFDPPYLPLSQTANFTAYTKGGFSFRDHLHLGLVAQELVRSGNRVVLSNHDLPVTREVYQWLGFEIHGLQARRSIGASAKTRKKVGEIIAVGG